MKQTKTCAFPCLRWKRVVLALLLGPASEAAYADLQKEMFTVTTTPVELSAKAPKKSLTFTLTPTAGFTEKTQAHVRLCGNLPIPGLPDPSATDKTKAMKALLTYFEPKLTGKEEDLIDAGGLGIVLKGGSQAYTVTVPLAYIPSDGDKSYTLGIGVSSPVGFQELVSTCTDSWKTRRFTTATVRMLGNTTPVTFGNPELTESEDGHTAAVVLDVLGVTGDDNVTWTSKGARTPVKMQKGETLRGENGVPKGQRYTATLQLPVAAADVKVLDRQNNERAKTTLTLSGNVTLKAAEIQPLDWTQQVVRKDGKMFRATVNVLNTVAGDGVSWREVIDGKPGKAIPMTPQASPPGTYTVDMPIPTQLNYTAQVIVHNDAGPRGAATVVNGPDTHPEVTFRPCTPTQCIIRWGAVIPYRDDQGRLGVNLKLMWDAHVKDSKAPNIFAIQSDSRWQDPDLFNGGGAPEALYTHGNMTGYFGAQSSLFSDGVMPHLGAFTLNFEPVAP